MAALAPGARPHREGQALRRRSAPLRQALRRQDRRGAHLQVRFRQPALRRRLRAGAAADPDFHPERARLRRPRRRRRGQPVRRLPALPHLGSAPCRRHRGPRRRELAPGHRAVGRHAVPEPLQALSRPHHAAHRLQCLDGRAHGRRSRLAHQIRQICRPRRLHEVARASTLRASRASACRCATGTVSCVSRCSSRRPSSWSASRRSRASCINSASSTRSASTSPKPNAERSPNERCRAQRRQRHQKSSRRTSRNALQGRLCRAARHRFQLSPCRLPRPWPTRPSSPTRRTTRCR